MNWGFVGLGQMGLPMARRLSARVDLRAYDLRSGDFAGLDTVETAAELSGCEVLVTCLPDGRAVRNVLFGEPGLADSLGKPGVVIDTSTTTHAAALDIGARLAERGIAFLDAPVSGMQARAEEGTLTMMVGGAAEQLAPLRDPLGAMASRILHVGPVGAGQLAKLTNQLLFDINMAALAEILPISAKLGLDPGQVAEIVNSGTGRSYASEFFLPNILQGVFDQGYPMQAAYKDLIAGAAVTNENGFPAPVLAAATATYQQALAEGFGGEDKGAMIKVFERLVGAAFRSRE